MDNFEVKYNIAAAILQSNILVSLWCKKEEEDMMPDCIREVALEWSETKSRTLTRAPVVANLDEVFSVTRTMIASRWGSFLSDSIERKAFFKTSGLRDLLIEDWDMAPLVASPRSFESPDELASLMKRTFSKIVDMVEEESAHYIIYPSLVKTETFLEPEVGKDGWTLYYTDAVREDVESKLNEISVGIATNLRESPNEDSFVLDDNSLFQAFKGVLRLAYSYLYEGLESDIPLFSAFLRFVDLRDNFQTTKEVGEEGYLELVGFVSSFFISSEYRWSRDIKILSTNEGSLIGRGRYITIWMREEFANKYKLDPKVDVGKVGKNFLDLGLEMRKCKLDTEVLDTLYDGVFVTYKDKGYL